MEHLDELYSPSVVYFFPTFDFIFSLSASLFPNISNWPLKSHSFAHTLILRISDTVSTAA